MKEIDVLSVTTTVEVGMYLGSLNAIYQSNMPPRGSTISSELVGQEGGDRRSVMPGQRVDSSHDACHYRKPERITGDECPMPRLTIS